MKSVFRIFFGAKGTRPWLVVLCLVLAGFSQAVGLMTFLPVVTELTGGPTKNSAPLNQHVKDVFVSAGLEPSLENLLLMFVAGMALKALFSFAAMLYVSHAVAKVATNIRAELIGKLMNARWAYFVDQKVGRITNVISNDATRAGSAYSTAGRFISFLFQGTAYVAVALVMSWQLALVGLLVGGMMALALNILVRISRRAAIKQVARTSDLVTYLSDTLNNFKPIKAMERKQWFVDLFKSKIKALKKSLFRQFAAQEGRIYAEEIILVCSVGAGAYIAVSLWKIPMPELLVMGIVFYQVIAILGKIQKNLQSAVRLESSYWAVQNLTREAAAQPESNTGTLTPTLEKNCRFENVSFSYRDDRPVLRDITFEAHAGEITVLRGTSGMGKTTLVDLLIGLYQPNTGNILIDGTPLKQIDLTAWRHLIGYVPQDCDLVHDTVLANITLGDEGLSEKDVKEALSQAGALAFVEDLPEGMMSIVGERGARFSGGQRQRVALARALVTKPKLLILDEVTSALDPDTEKEICRNIRRLERGYTILAITHRPIWADIASRLYLVENGKVKLERSSKKRQKVAI